MVWRRVSLTPPMGQCGGKGCWSCLLGRPTCLLWAGAFLRYSRNCHWSARPPTAWSFRWAEWMMGRCFQAGWRNLQSDDQVCTLRVRGLLGPEPWKNSPKSSSLYLGTDSLNIKPWNHQTTIGPLAGSPPPLSDGLLWLLLTDIRSQGRRAVKLTLEVSDSRPKAFNLNERRKVFRFGNLKALGNPAYQVLSFCASTLTRSRKSLLCVKRRGGGGSLKKTEREKQIPGGKICRNLWLKG